MSAIDTAMTVIHLLVGATWVGAVAFVAGVVLPAARDGKLNAQPVESMLGSLTTWSRVAAVLLLVTGSHLLFTTYSIDALLGSSRGHLVVTMVVLWLALTGLVEVGRSKLVDGLQERRVRAPARDGLPWFRAAAAVGVALLVVAGLLG
jgi:uncharacterized membrane protein